MLNAQYEKFIFSRYLNITTTVIIAIIGAFMLFGVRHRFMARKLPESIVGNLNAHWVQADNDLSW